MYRMALVVDDSEMSLLLFPTPASSDINEQNPNHGRAVLLTDFYTLI